MPELQQRIAQVIEERRLFAPGQRLLVAVSGGLDSMVLLHVLHRLAGSNKWDLALAHLNHQLRGRSSAADERLVGRLAADLKLPLIVERCDVRSLSSRHKLSLEMAARAARHEFLARTALRLGIRDVVLAHHADDQVEQFFLRLIRGAGSEALAGMKWRSVSPASKQVELVRPLLGVAKEDLQAFARVHRVKFREDATNASSKILRNRIRWKLIPLLERQYQPAIRKCVQRVAETLAAESDFVTSAASEWLQRLRARSPGAKFDLLHPAVQRRIIVLQLQELAVQLDFQLVEDLRRSTAKIITVPAFNQSFPDATASNRSPTALRITRTAEGELRRVEPDKNSFLSEILQVHLNGPSKEVTFGKIKVRWAVQSQGYDSRAVKAINTELFDYERVGNVVELGHWKPGDRFQPIGMTQAVKLQDIFTNRKVPKEHRHDLVLARTGTGEIFWVEGLRISERFKLTKATIRRLRWCWDRL